MRISASPARPGADYAAADLADPLFYTTGDPHLVWQSLRTAEPLFWHEHPGEGFWVVTRRADVRRVLSEHENFSSQHGTSIAMLGGPDPAAGLMMQATDPPRHQRLREQIGQPLSAHSVPAYEQQVRVLVKRALAPAKDGGVWDVAAAFAELPMAVTAGLMGLPGADVGPLTNKAFATLAPLDPRHQTGSERETMVRAHYQIMQYFAACRVERAKRPTADLLSRMMSVQVEGRPLTEQEFLFNCLSLTVGAAVTTSQVVNATLLVLIGQHGGEGRWPDVPVDALVEEALRWSSPVTHFMRRARRDIELHGKIIRTGQAVTAWIASANRDESVFDRAFEFSADRQPNRHVAFGSGPHRCVGAPLARLMLRLMFEELMAAVESFELAGPPSHLVSNQIAGIASLPIRVKPRCGR